MKAKATPGFWKRYAQLPQNIQRRARKAYQLWQVDSRHPSLHFKRVDKVEPIHPARVSDDYRALGVLEEDIMTWFWIGSHAEYDQMLK